MRSLLLSEQNHNVLAFFAAGFFLVSGPTISLQGIGSGAAKRGIILLTRLWLTNRSLSPYDSLKHQMMVILAIVELKNIIETLGCERQTLREISSPLTRK